MWSARCLLGWISCPFLAAGASDLVGAAACAECHPQHYARQAPGRHARALRPIRDTPLPQRLMDRPLQEPDGASFEYRLAAGGLAVEARKGNAQAGAALEWAFGAGAQAFTPVGRAGRIYFEHRISYYTEPQRPALTLGHPAPPSPSATDALGLVQAAETIYRCFHCHATGVQPGVVQPDLSEMRPGVECERCHGPGRAHVAAARDRRPAAQLVKTILNPGRFPASAVVQIERMITAGEYRKALSGLEKMPSSAARWHLLVSKAHDGLDDPARAVAEAQAARDLEPRQEGHHLQLAQIFLSRNTPQPAYEILSDAQQLFPDPNPARICRLPRAIG